MKIRVGYVAIFAFFSIIAFVNIPLLSEELQPDKEESKFLKSDDAFESVETKSEILAPPTPEFQSKKTRLLENAKRDLESLRLFAKQLHRHNEMDDIEIMEEVSNDFMKEYIDELLSQERSSSHYETVRLSVVILFTKAMLFYEFNNMDGVSDVMDELKANYSQYYDIAVNHFGYDLVRESIENFDKINKEKRAAQMKSEHAEKKASLSNNIKDLSDNIKDLSNNVKNISNIGLGVSRKTEERVKAIEDKMSAEPEYQDMDEIMNDASAEAGG
jgi:hypothetical protein